VLILLVFLKMLSTWQQQQQQQRLQLNNIHNDCTDMAASSPATQICLTQPPITA
jgi:hypothetical protein